MNISSGDDLYVSGFNRDLRSDIDDAISVAKSFTSMSIASSNHSSLLHGKSESSGSPPGAHGAGAPGARATAPTTTPTPPPGEDGPIEVDFYRNPTVLSRMILYNKFASANKRCRDHPIEAAVWVCAKRKSNVTQVSPFLRGMLSDRSRSNRSTRTSTSSSGGGRGGGGDGKGGGNAHAQQRQSSSRQQSSSAAHQDENQYSLRQLPIHIACTSLAFAHDATSRSELEQLIVRLVVTYPEGCAEFDHGGKLPLHEAIWSNASSETTAMLLMASPQSIERRDKFGRTPMELNNRRTGDKKSEIRDMLLLGVNYWDQARQEAKLRMKLVSAPPPSDNKSIDSISVLGTSQIEKETIYTSESVELPPRRKPHPVQIIESEEIVPMAWEQLERRVILLEQLLAEMYEKNYELAGLVEELKKTKVELAVELKAARSATATATVTATPHPLQQPQQQFGTSAATPPSVRSARSPTRSSLGSCPSVAVVPEDDEVSSVKLMEHAERIEQLESLVGSYHSTRRKRRNTSGSSISRISELSSVSSQTGNGGAFARDRSIGLARQDSLVSGLTEEASYFDTSIHAVKAVWRREDLQLVEETMGTSSQQVSEVLGTDNLTEMFTKAAELHGSSRTFSGEALPRREWSPPVAATSFLPTTTTNDVQSELPAPMAVEEDDEGEEEDMSAEMSSIRRAAQDGRSPAPAPAPITASEIYFPGFYLEPTSAHFNSTISISASSAESSGAAMSENSTIVSDEREIYFAVHRDSLGTVDDTTTVADEEHVSSATRSTRARLEDLVFGSAPGDGQEHSDGSGHQPQRYNYDIRIPALDTFYPSSDTGEI